MTIFKQQVLSRCRKRKKGSDDYEVLLDYEYPEAEIPENHDDSDIIHPQDSKLKYRKLVLDNKLDVLLVSCPDFTQHGAAIAVGCGSYDDPPKMFGLAHLLEHMLFLGSVNYPGINKFKEFINLHGGEYFAKTELDHLLVSMRVSSSNVDLNLALDMFVDILSQPLMDHDLLQQEVTTIDAEFGLHRYRDSSRHEQLLFHTAPEHHQFHRFPWGNKDSLSDPDSLHKAITKLFKASYVASNMKLVVVSPLGLDYLCSLVRSVFGKLNHSEPDEKIVSWPMFLPINDFPTREIWDTSYCYYLESLEDSPAMHITWIIPD